MWLTCDPFEIYLRYWVNYNKIPILTVDYKKGVFPVGLKDCFDVYLWLRKASEDEIRSTLGFYPKQIVITGDSAGGNLGLGVALVLNDLRTDYKSKFHEQIQMPDGLVLLYAPFLLKPDVCPSKYNDKTMRK